ncbi:MAG: chemotaxis family two-component system response regulator Rcp1 [Gammaproteobacteria bacterium]|jgi:chemotaxis family two-component system response regulator Rcp1
MQSAVSSQSLCVLLVEDNDGDAVLAEEAFRETSVAVSMQRVADGIDALAYLQGEGEYADAVRPDLILLDLNMPRMGGHEVLAHIKADTRLCTIPVVVLTTSQSDRDVIDSYSLHANCYISKPIDFDRFTTVVKNMTDFWFGIARLPPKN